MPSLSVVGQRQSRVVHEEKVVFHPADGRLGVSDHVRGDDERVALGQGDGARLLAEERAVAVDNLLLDDQLKKKKRGKKIR